MVNKNYGGRRFCDKSGAAGQYPETFSLNINDFFTLSELVGP